MNTSPIPSLEQMLDKLGPLTRERIVVEGQEFFLERPSNSDKLFADPAVRLAHEQDQYLPYWADLWPAARMLSKVLVNEPLPPGGTAIEVGCGLGLAGIIALSRGLKVVFTDYDPCALHFAAHNARLNGFDEFRTLLVDWRHPPADLQASLVLGSDLVYELRIVPPLVAFLEKILLPGGRCLLADQDRIPGITFREAIESVGLQFTTQMVRAGEPGGRRMKGTLYRIAKPA
jgi:predicted nicotinamide N-methyase